MINIVIDMISVTPGNFNSSSDFSFFRLIFFIGFPILWFVITKLVSIWTNNKKTLLIINSIFCSFYLIVLAFYIALLLFFGSTF